MPTSSVLENQLKELMKEGSSVKDTATLTHFYFNSEYFFCLESGADVKMALEKYLFCDENVLGGLAASCSPQWQGGLCINCPAHNLKLNF